MRFPVRFSFRPWGRLIVALIVAFSTAAWAAEEASVRPGVNRHYLRPDINVAEWVERFEGESREIYALRHAIAAAVGIEDGDVVADVGAGTGLFVPLFAARAGRETVVEEIQAAGFVLEEMDAVDGLKENYFLRFRKP